jgi:hypothetical protein
MYGTVADIISNSGALETMQALEGGFLSASVQPISSRAAGGHNPLSLQAVDQTWLAFSTAWQRPEDDTTAHGAGRTIVSEVERAAGADGGRLPYLFMNDASWDQDVISGYGDENIRKMKLVQERYDPTGVFQSLVPGGFKLG